MQGQPAGHGLHRLHHSSGSPQLTANTTAAGVPDHQPRADSLGTDSRALAVNHGAALAVRYGSVLAAVNHGVALVVRYGSVLAAVNHGVALVEVWECACSSVAGLRLRQPGWGCLFACCAVNIVLPHLAMQAVTQAG
eukprot:91558-Pelagomonas_calceolata.AAC.1